MFKNRKFVKGTIFSKVYSILLVIPIILVFFYYNFFNLKFLVYFGWVTLIFSFIILYQSKRNQKAVEMIENKIVDSKILVDARIYALVRYPEYLGFIFLIFGLILISQHWLSIFSGVIGIILFYIDIKSSEKKDNLKKYSEDYRLYINEVPRLNILKGIYRFLQRKKK